jgi:hypothetical protein
MSVIRALIARNLSSVEKISVSPQRPVRTQQSALRGSGVLEVVVILTQMRALMMITVILERSVYWETVSRGVEMIRSV